MALKAGELAPDCRVALRPRQWVSLKDFVGEKPVVLLFFPLAFSSTCTSEMCTIAEDWSSWQGLGAHIFGISVDSPYANAKFAEETGAQFPILSDFNREASRAYDVLRADLGGLLEVSERAVFVIDRSGRISYAWLGENPGVFPPLEEIKDAVRRLN